MNSSAFPTVIGHRYYLSNLLGAGGMGSVYRALDRLTGQSVALKRVTAAPDQLQFGTQDESSDLRVALAREFAALSSLKHPHIISVLDYGFEEDGQPYFTMDLLENAQPLNIAAENQPLDARINLLAQMLQALAYLHRRGILHRDLKPGNVLVANGQVKVLDFGLAVAREQLNDTDAIATGTLAYMAPEILMGDLAREASDLYAVGVIAYQVLTGNHPFDTSNISLLLNDILHKIPDVTHIENSALAAAIAQLLDKNPAQRLITPTEIITLLGNATGQHIQTETAATRESFIQAAEFIGRRWELGQLKQAMSDAIDGQGSAWLVGGESGVGKSRLLNEVRTIALVQGALVLRGQAVNEGGAVYQLWREPLRWLSLISDLSDLEAGVLKNLVPDIATLLERDIMDAQPLDPQGTQRRLFNVIERVIRRQRQPLVLLLEDLHWADDSLSILSQIAALTRDLPILIIGTFRDDERPDLPANLPGLVLIKLSRLVKAEIAQLSESMLGINNPAVIARLEQETEGNVFFLVEVVRVLAEEAGQLGKIGQVPLPESVFAGGVEQIIQRRLHHVPADGHALLQFAAATGRQLDLDLLRVAEPTANLEQWLTGCSNVAVLEFQDDQWRFSHDKLRDAVLVNLQTPERQSLHKQVAEVIEAVYPDVVEQYAALAYHWGSAANLPKEVDYAQRAGQVALRNSAYLDAVRQFTRSLTALAKLPGTPERTQTELTLQISLGVALLSIKGYTAPEVKQAWTRAYEVARAVEHAPEHFQALWGLWSFYVVQPNFKQALELAQQMFTLAECTQDRVFFLVGHWVLGVTYYGLADFELARTHLEQSIALYRSQEDRSLSYMYGQDPCVTSLGWLAHTLWRLGYPDQARQRMQEAVALAEGLQHPFTLAYIQGNAALFYTLLPDIQMVSDSIQKMVTLSTEQGFILWIAWAHCLRAWVLTENGHPAASVAEYTQGLAIIRMIGAEIELPYVLSLEAEALGLAGQTDEGLRVIDQAFAIIAQTEERSSEPELYRIKGELLMLDNRPHAEEFFEKAITIARQQHSKSWELRATTSRAYYWEMQGKKDAAQQSLQAISEWFTQNVGEAVSS